MKNACNSLTLDKKGEFDSNKRLCYFKQFVVFLSF